MIHSRQLMFLLTATTIYLLGAPFQAETWAAVVLNDGGSTSLRAVARDRDVSFPASTTNTLWPTTLPYSDSHSAVVGDSSSVVKYALSESSFEVSSVEARDGSLDSYGRAQGDRFFSVSVDTPYLLSGSISTVDPGGKSVTLKDILSDVDTMDVLFTSYVLNLHESGQPSANLIVRILQASRGTSAVAPSCRRQRDAPSGCLVLASPR